ncbi:hypothetical protein O0L34_g6765 [Tuta absoluta]|nr:hypothetical protein O0L34_g6765 [Tuta absoluta]
MIPPSQYDIPISPKFKMTYALVRYWELIPMFLTVCTSILILFIAIVWAFKNKVDAVYTSHSRDCISRTMDLRNPSIHKMLIINQRYEPWEEMQRVLDRMKFAEKRALTRVNLKKCYPHA